MTWLYIPSSFAPESACLERESAPHSSFSASSIEPFATWNARPLLPANLPRLWKREPLIRRLSGLTYSRSEAQTGADLWIASLRASRAKTSPLRAAGLGSTANAQAYSSMCSTLPTIAERSSSFWRTSQASLLPPPPLWTKPKAISKSERPPESWENWPTAGGTRNGSLFPRPTWVPAMGEPGGSVSPGAVRWDTPDTMPEMPNTGSNRKAQPAGLGNQAKLVASQKWPTPDAAMHQGANTSQGPAGSRPNIALASRMWTTPDVCSGARDMSKIDPELQKRANTKRTTGLPTEAAMWLTPNVPNGGRSVSPELVASHGMTETGEKRTVGLESQTRHWATPTAQEFTGAGHPESKQGAMNLRSQTQAWAPPDCNTSSYSIGKFGPNLRQQATDWPTPRATDGTKGGPNQAGSKGDLMLPSAAAQWPTPASRDYRTPNSQESQESQESRKHTGGEQLPNFIEHHFLPLAPQIPSGVTFSVPVVSVHGAELSPTTRPEHVLGRLRLNPAFGCWLMGWPSWWTNPGLTSFAKSEMVSYRSALQQQLSYFFDAPDLLLEVTTPLELT